MDEPTPRVPLRGIDDDPRLAELFAKGLSGPDGSILNIFGALGNHPDLLRRWLVFSAHILAKSSLSPRVRELVILRTGWNCRSRYEWGQHVLIARDCGMTDDEIDAVRVGPADPSWDAQDGALLRAVDELHHSRAIGDHTWQELCQFLSTEQVLDLVATVGNYTLVAMFLNTLRVPLDAGVPAVDLRP
jgi:4-carboxymuconolactone decarboxylase